MQDEPHEAHDALLRAPTPLRRRLSERARAGPTQLGARLEAIKARRGWDDNQLAAALGGTPDALVWARLCAVPRDRAGCAFVAARCSLSAGTLAHRLGLSAATPREEGPWPAR
jgi:hypothetical protein